MTSRFSLRNNARNKQRKMTKNQEARIVHHYENTEEKLLETNAAIWFNKKSRFNHFMPKYIHITVIGQICIILNKRCQMLHYWYHNICRRNVAYFIAVCFKETPMLAPWRWRHNNAETFNSYSNSSLRTNYRIVHSLVLQKFSTVCSDHKSQQSQGKSLTVPEVQIPPSPSL